MKITSDPFKEEGAPGPVVVDMTSACVLETVQAAGVVGKIRGGRLLAVELEGPLLDAEGRSDVLYLVDADGAAQICAHVMNTIIGFDDHMAVEFHTRLQELLEAGKRGRA